MPSPISFFPVDCGSAKPGGVAPAASNEAPADASASFDSVLNQAAPAAGKPTTQSAVSDPTAESPEQEKSGVADESSEEPATPGRAILSAQELAALLAMMSASAQQPAPLPVAPVDVNLKSDSPEVNADNEASLPTPSLVTEEGQAVFVPRAPRSEASNVASFQIPAESSEPLTARELLEQGAEVIDYDLTSDVVKTPAESDRPAAASTPVMKDAMIPPTAMNAAPAAPKKAAAASDVTSKEESTEPELVASQVRVSETVVAPAAALTAPNTQRLASKKSSEKGVSEKFAVPGLNQASTPASGVNSSNGASKNNFLNVDSESLEGESPVVGTRAANWGNSMNPESRPVPFAPRLIDGAAAVDAVFPGVHAAEKTSESTATPPAQAAQIVHEIRDIADSLWAVERNSVEVRFHFNEKENLSVRVEYRDGVVKTTFRTDSPELRDTIAREWQSQVASASDSRPYRVADPVFNTPPADARGFSLGGDSSRQQRQAEQSAGAQNTFAATFGRSPSSSSSVAAAAPALVRPDTALHLHAFA